MDHLLSKDYLENFRPRQRAANRCYPHRGSMMTAASAPSPSRSKQRDFPAGFPRGYAKMLEPRLWAVWILHESPDRLKAGLQPVATIDQVARSAGCGPVQCIVRCVSPWPAARTVCHDRRGSLTIRWQVTQVPAHSVSQETMCVGQPSKCGSGNTPQKFHWSNRTKMNPYGQDRSRGDAPGGASTRALGIVTQTGAAAAS